MEWHCVRFGGVEDVLTFDPVLPPLLSLRILPSAAWHRISTNKPTLKCTQLFLISYPTV